MKYRIYYVLEVLVRLSKIHLIFSFIFSIGLAFKNAEKSWNIKCLVDGSVYPVQVWIVGVCIILSSRETPY